MNKLKYYSILPLLFAHSVFAEGTANPALAFEVLVPTVMLSFILLVLIILMILLDKGLPLLMNLVRQLRMKFSRL